MTADPTTHMFIERWQQHLRQLRIDYYSDSRETRTPVAKNIEYCFVVKGVTVEGKPGTRKLTEEPTFCAPNEDPVPIGPPNSTHLPQVTSARKCPACPTPEPPRPASGEVNTTSLIKSLRKDVQRVEDENTRLKRENETLRHKNALQQRGQGVGQRETDADVQKLKDKAQQLEKERSDLLLEKIWLTKLQVSKVYELNKEIARLKRENKKLSQGVDVTLACFNKDIQ